MRLKIQNPYSKVPQWPYLEKSVDIVDSVGDPKKMDSKFCQKPNQ